VALQAFEHGGFERIAVDGMAVVAGSFIAGIRAADALGIEDDECSAAASAARKAREEITRTAPVPVSAFLLAGVCAAQRFLPRLDRLP
jgi:hypothetical protein